MTSTNGSAGGGTDLQSWAGQQVRARNGHSLGTLDRVYDERGSDRAWGAVKAGRRHHLVPLNRADAQDGGLRLAVDPARVRKAPTVEPDGELSADTEQEAQRYYSEDELAGRGRAGRLAVRRSRGALSGLLLIPLGSWGAVIPFVGPYFDYSFGTAAPWVFTLDRLWLSILPGLAVLLGGLILGPSANRIGGGIGAQLALAGGIWFVVGPVLAQLWGAPGPEATYGLSTGPSWLQTLVELGYFYGLGVVVTTLAAFALGRLTVRSVRD